jgi:hypothetical protein
MNIETLQLVADTLTINFLFHAAVIGSVTLFADYQIRRFIADLPTPREIH